MKTLQEIKNILHAHKDEIYELYHVKGIGIFGSFIRGENSVDSDLDILVEFSEPVSLFDFIDLEDYIQNITGVKVDLVSRKGLKPRIGSYILDEVVYI